MAVRGHDLLPQPKPPDQSGWNIPNFELLLATGFALWDPGGSTLQLLWSDITHELPFHFCALAKVLDPSVGAHIYIQSALQGNQCAVQLFGTGQSIEVI
jgi:hypothetical protein